jgi:hypothetical protein
MSACAEEPLSPHDVIEWLNAVGTIVTAVATVAICVFAYVQIRQASQERRDKRRAALSSLRIEQYRLRHIAERWAQYDLVGMALQGTLDPRELTPPDWGMVAGLLGLAGDTAGVLASVSYGRLSDARYYANQLIALAGHLNRDVNEFGTPLSGSSQIGAQMKSIESEIRTCLQECADGLSDALAAADPEGWRAELPSHLHSAVARKLRDAIDESDGKSSRGGEA